MDISRGTAVFKHKIGRGPCREACPHNILVTRIPFIRGFSLYQRPKQTEGQYQPIPLGTVWSRICQVKGWVAQSNKLSLKEVTLKSEQHNSNRVVQLQKDLNWKLKQQNSNETVWSQSSQARGYSRRNLPEGWITQFQRNNMVPKESIQLRSIAFSEQPGPEESGSSAKWVLTDRQGLNQKKIEVLH